MATVSSGLKVTELAVFVLSLLVVTIIGLLAARWRASGKLRHLDEWGLAGRKLGPWTTWVLLGGDLYTASAFLAVPGLLYAVGGGAFYVMPYLLIAFPLVLLPLLRLWSVSHVHGYVTPADFVRGRYGSPALAFLIAITGIVATMPYIALQMLGLAAVIKTMGVSGTGSLIHLPLGLAFLAMALYTVRSGLRASTLIAFAKDGLVFVVVLVAILYLPIKLGGWADIFTAAENKFAGVDDPSVGLLLGPDDQLHYATLALGAALALFLYPHAITGVLAARGRDVIKKNLPALPAFSLAVGSLTLLGFCAIAAGVRPIVDEQTGKADYGTVIPLLFDQEFPNWFSGVAFGAMAIAVLVPASIMAIGAANLWARNVYRPLLRRDATPAQETRQAKIASFVVLLGALACVLLLDPQYAIDLQMVGGVLILQTLPAVAIALYTKWLHRYALIAGWLAGGLAGGGLMYGIKNLAGRPFAGTTYRLADLDLGGFQPFAGAGELTIYVGFVALLVNLLVAVVCTLLFRLFRLRNGRDHTGPDDYYADQSNLMAWRQPVR